MDIVSFQSFVLESLGGCISSNTKIVSPCSHLGFLQDEQKLSRDHKNGPADSEEIEMDELYFDRDRQSPAGGKETVNSQKPITREEDQMQKRHKQLKKMNRVQDPFPSTAAKERIGRC